MGIPEGAKCCAKIWEPGAWRPRQCSKAAKVERDGKFYCGVHDPVRLQAKRDETHARWKAEADADRRRRDRQAAITAARDNIVTIAQMATRQTASWDDVARAVEAWELAERKAP